MALPAILAPVAGILIQKGLGGLVDILSSVGDAGIAKVKDLIFEKTGIDITNQSQVAELDPNQVLHLREVLINNYTEFLRIQNLNRGQDLDNTKDARNMNVQLAKLGIKQGFWTFPNVLTLILVGFFVAFIPCLIWFDIPEANIRFADTILGFVLGTVLSQITNYYYGSSMKETSVADNEKWKNVMSEITNPELGLGRGERRRAIDRLPQSSVVFTAPNQIPNPPVQQVTSLPVTDGSRVVKETVLREFPLNDVKPTSSFNVPSTSDYTEKEKLASTDLSESNKK